MSALDSVIAPIHRAGWPFVTAFAVAAALLATASTPLGWIGLVLTAWCAYFFRDPARVTPTRPGLVVAPADGRVQMIARAVPPPELGLGEIELTRVSIFLNVFDVHINRVPVEGTVRETAYRPGTFLNAALDKASEQNERAAVRLTLPDGRDMVVVQIAGLVARRIINHLVPGQAVRAGERFGLIRFGSRTDIYLPEGVNPLVTVGQRMIGGETVIADLTSSEPAREGEVR
jgi:phosphatidylserine decarboxylase